MSDGTASSSVGLAVPFTAGLIAVVPGATIGSLSAAALGAVGAVALPIAVRRSSGRGVTIGAALLYGSVLLAGLGGAGPVSLLVGAVGGVVAWDSGENAVALHRQVRPINGTGPVELLHASATAGVLTVALLASALLYYAVVTSPPLVVLVVLLAAVLALTAALRH